jgi:hypothetical protein
MKWKQLSRRWDKKVRGDDDVPGDVLRLLGEDSLRIVTQLINNM